MSRSKIGNTFKAYQEEKQKRREKLIHDWTEIAQKSRAKYRYVTDIAKAVAVHIARVEGRDCHSATFLRNKRYKAILLSYLAECVSGRGEQKRLVGNNGVSTHFALTLSQLETGNVYNENLRLKNHIADLESQINLSQSEAKIFVGQACDEKNTEEVADLLKKYVHTCQTLLLVLERRKDVLGIDQKKMQIIDSSMLRGNKIIVDAVLAKPFFDWYQTNQANHG